MTFVQMNFSLTEVRDILGCAAQLERLDPEMLPAITACSSGKNIIQI